MYTYIIKSQDLYKIGKTVDMENRISQYRTHNPMFEIVQVIRGDHETELHYRYASKRSHLEWYRLSKEDIEYIKRNYTVIQEKPVSKKETSETKLLKALAKYIEYNTNEFYLNMKRKEELTKITDLKYNTISQCLTRLVKKNLLLRVSNSTYQMNPNIMFKGEDLARAKYVEITHRYEICPECGEPEYEEKRKKTKPELVEQ